MRYFPNLKSQDKGSGKAQASGSSDAPKKSRFYALCSRGDQETSRVVTGMLKLFTIDVYSILDPGAILSFFTPLVAKKFDILHEAFIVYTPAG